MQTMEIDKAKIIHGKGDGYMNCFSCGTRMTIVECGKNRFEGQSFFYGYRVVSWCDNCYKDIIRES